MIPAMFFSLIFESPHRLKEPIPKEHLERKELEKAFGKINDPDQKCKFTRSGDGMAVHVPAGHFSVGEIESRSNAPRTERPVKGDFHIRVRIRCVIKMEKRRTYNREHRIEASIVAFKDRENYAGHALRIMENQEDMNYDNSTRLTTFTKGEFRGKESDYTNLNGSSTLLWLNLTRVVNEFSAEWSLDGKKWEQNR